MRFGDYYSGKGKGCKKRLGRRELHAAPISFFVLGQMLAQAGEMPPYTFRTAIIVKAGTNAPDVGTGGKVRYSISATHIFSIP